MHTQVYRNYISRYNNCLPSKSSVNPPKIIGQSNAQSIAISYMILAPNEMKSEPDDRKAAKLCLEKIALDPEWYRIGHTKARNI